MTYRLPIALLCVALLSACAEEPAEAEATAESEAAAEDVAETEPQQSSFYVGTWAADPTWCTDQSEGFPITIEADRFLGRENTCEMTDITETPEGGWSAQLSCVSEGTTTTEPIVLSPAGEQLAVTWPDRAADSTLFSRCE